jgi:arylformamidase
MPIDPFRTRDHVPDFEEKVREYERRSAEVRLSLRKESDIQYGPHPAQKLDIFFPNSEGSALPVHMFIHGGYWRMFSKDDFSYVARTVTDAGAIAVVIDYALMPGVRLAEIVGQIRKAKAWVTKNIGHRRGDPQRLTVSGHSAGAHLATSLFTSGQEYPPCGILLLGGVYDIGPLQYSFLQPLINLTDDEVRLFSPMNYEFQSGIGVDILYGERETEPFHAQAARLARRLIGQGCEVRLKSLRDSDHMSSVLDMGVPSSEAGTALTSVISRTVHDTTPSQHAS